MLTNPNSDYAQQWHPKIHKLQSILKLINDIFQQYTDLINKEYTSLVSPDEFQAQIAVIQAQSNLFMLLSFLEERGILPEDISKPIALDSHQIAKIPTGDLIKKQNQLFPL